MAMKKESDLPYDGPFSIYAEWHAAMLGLYYGYTTDDPTDDELPDYDDVQEEPWYYTTMYLIGTLLQ